MDLVSLDDVRSAASLLEAIAVRSPLELSRVLSARARGPTYLKCENLQRTGSFKIRGAYNRIARLSDAERGRGVVAASAGNHAQGVALAATSLGVKATVFMPAGAPLPKVEACASYGAEVVLDGAVYDEAYDAALAFCEERGAVMVHPFDHPHVIAGQGTIALEIAEQLPDAASIVVPVGGGGLISGIAAAAKALRPEIRIVGVEPAGARTVGRALEAGGLVTLDELTTVADGLAARRAGEVTFLHVRELVDEMVTVTDDEIAEALLVVVERAKLLVEPAGAAGVAGLMRLGDRLPHPTVVLLSGGNIDPLLLLRVIRFGMSSAGRYFSFRTRLTDRPGELARLAATIARAGANVVGIQHHREGARLELGQVEVAIQVETRGTEHVAELTRALEGADYLVEPL